MILYTDGKKAKDFQKNGKSFRPPFSKGGAVGDAQSPSPSADGEIFPNRRRFLFEDKNFSLFQYKKHNNRLSKNDFINKIGKSFRPPFSKGGAKNLKKCFCPLIFSFIHVIISAIE